MKRPKRLASLAQRVTGQAYQPRELPNLDNTGRSITENALRRVVGHENPQSLTTEEGVIPLPDEEELEKVRRRRAARRGGGRASTVLTDENRLGG